MRSKNLALAIWQPCLGLVVVGAAAAAAGAPAALNLLSGAAAVFPLGAAAGTVLKIGHFNLDKTIGGYAIWPQVRLKK